MIKVKEKEMCHIFGIGKLYDIASATLERVKDIYKDRAKDGERPEICACISEAIDLELIYTDDVWEIMKGYQTPENADYNEAMDAFFNDLLSVVEE